MSWGLMKHHFKNFLIQALCFSAFILQWRYSILINFIYKIAPLLKAYRIIVLLCSLLLILAVAEAQTSPTGSFLYFNHLSKASGLSSDDVKCIYRDSRGFLWIGTTFGLNEYDGRTVQVFRHNRFDAQSLPDNLISCIAEDDSGYLWIGTSKGIGRFNPYNHQSTNYRHDSRNACSLPDNIIKCIYFDRQKTLWVGTESGLCRLDRKTGCFTKVHLLPDPLDKTQLSAISSFLEDRQDRFWIGTYSGLVLYDRAKKQASYFAMDPASADPGGNAITSVFEDHSGRIWTPVWGKGLCRFDPEAHTFTSYTWNHNNPYPGTVNIVFSMAETGSDSTQYTLWLGTSEGLMKIDYRDDDFPPALQSSLLLRPDLSQPHAVSQGPVNDLSLDQQHILWIGTQHGINEYLPGNQLFSQVAAIRGSVNRIWVDSSQNSRYYYIAAWYGDGLVKLDKNFHLVQSWHFVPPGSHTRDNSQISDVIRARNGLLWIATFNGLYSLDEHTGRFTSYLHQQDGNSPAGNQTTTVAEDDSGNIWIGTYGLGADRYDPVHRTFTHFMHNDKDSSSLCDNLVWNIYHEKGRIWIATNNGLGEYNEKQHSFINYQHQEDNPASLQGRSVAGMATDLQGNLWVATEEGLNQLDAKSGQFTLYSVEEGLASNDIVNIATDTSGNIWLTTAAGISQFDPLKKTFINYDEQNGLPAAVEGPLTADGYGNLLTTANHLLLRFSPASFLLSSRPPPVYITDMSINGQRLLFNKPVGPSHVFELKYPKNSFSCTFSAPEFLNGKNVKYAYKLDGLDAGWEYAGSRNFVTYANLAPGLYHLHVKAANSQGVWTEKATSLSFRVQPPFWNTWWFRIALLLFICLVVYALFIYRVRTIRKQEALKTSINKQIADMRLKVLHTQMNPHFLFNALNSIQECIYTQQTAVASRYLAKFSRLVRLILEHSEHSFISLGQEIELLTLYLELETLRFEESFTYKIETDSAETALLSIPPMLVQPFIENALWHGLLHKEGEKRLSVLFRADKENIYVTIEDNGIGRKAAKIKKSGKEQQRQSWGIQLSSRQLDIVSHLTHQQASVSIEDLFTAEYEPAGTRVRLTIPIVRTAVVAT